MKTSDNLQMTVYFISFREKVQFIFINESDRLYNYLKANKDKFETGLMAGYFHVTRGEFYEVYKSFSEKLIIEGLEYNTIIAETLHFFYTFNLKTKSIEYVNLVEFYSLLK